MIFDCFNSRVYEKDDSILIDKMHLPRADCNLFNFFDLGMQVGKFLCYFFFTILIVPVKLSWLSQYVEKEFIRPTDILWQTLSFSDQQVMYNRIRSRTVDGFYSLST